MNKPITSKEMKDWVGKTWDRCQKQAWSEAMNRDEIIRMAREAGAMFDHMTWVERDLAPVFERFAALVAAAEREAICQDLADMHVYGGTKGIQRATIEDCIRVVRARGEK